MFVFVGAAAACSGVACSVAACCGAACCAAACWAVPESSSLMFSSLMLTGALAAKLLAAVPVAAVPVAAVPVAVVGLGRLITMAAAPRALAAPAPRVMADTQASPLLRARCWAEADVVGLFMVLQARIGGCG